MPLIHPKRTQKSQSRIRLVFSSFPFVSNFQSPFVTRNTYYFGRPGETPEEKAGTRSKNPGRSTPEQPETTTMHAPMPQPHTHAPSPFSSGKLAGRTRTPHLRRHNRIIPGGTKWLLERVA
jgi:hypothetical protein